VRIDLGTKCEPDHLGADRSPVRQPDEGTFRQPDDQGPIGQPVRQPHDCGPVRIPVRQPHDCGPVRIPVRKPNNGGPDDSGPVRQPHDLGTVFDAHCVPNHASMQYCG